MPKGKLRHVEKLVSLRSHDSRYAEFLSAEGEIETRGEFPFSRNPPFVIFRISEGEVETRGEIPFSENPAFVIFRISEGEFETFHYSW